MLEYLPLSSTTMHPCANNSRVHSYFGYTQRLCTWSHLCFCILLFCAPHISVPVDVQHYSWTFSSHNQLPTTLEGVHARVDSVRTHLEAAQSVVVKDNKSAPPQTDAALLEYLLKTNRNLLSLHVESACVLSSSMFSLLAGFSKLNSLTLATPKDTPAVETDNLSLLCSVKTLRRVCLHLPHACLGTDSIVLFDFSVVVFQLHNLLFSGSVFFKQCCFLQTVILQMPALHSTDVFYFRNTVMKKALSMAVSSNSLAYLPSVLLYNPSVYLNLTYNPSGGFALAEHTSAGSSLHPGADALLNRIASSILQNKTPIMCCTAASYSTWGELADHHALDHKDRPVSLSTLIKNQRVSVPFPNTASKSKYTYYITPQERAKIKSFLVSVTVKSLGVLRNSVLVTIEEKARIHTVLQEQEILYAISSLHIGRTHSSVDVPSCFYKLYRLSSLTIEECDFPSLLKTVFSMPGLQHIEITKCVFEHSSSYLEELLRKVHVHSPSKNVLFLGCVSKHHVKSVQKGIFIAFSIFVLILLGLYVATIFITKKSPRSWAPATYNVK
ncbi:hypothetical protein NECID01_1935 [Nematocida sp. AWRm77]|nr:hypothetical protein NECID01_1935 [Nematocida sp. AWRm77]